MRRRVELVLLALYCLVGVSNLGIKMAEFTNLKAVPLRSAVFHILLHTSLEGWETTGAQLAPLLNMIGDGGTSGALVTEDMIKRVFACANDVICLPYSQLGIDEGGKKSVTIEKSRSGIMFKVITNTSHDS